MNYKYKLEELELFVKLLKESKIPDLQQVTTFQIQNILSIIGEESNNLDKKILKSKYLMDIIRNPILIKEYLLVSEFKSILNKLIKDNKIKTFVHYNIKDNVIIRFESDKFYYSISLAEPMLGNCFEDEYVLGIKSKVDHEDNVDHIYFSNQILEYLKTKFE